MADADISTNRELNFDKDIYKLNINVTVTGKDMRQLDSTLLRQLSEALSESKSLSFKFYVLEKLFRALGK